MADWSMLPFDLLHMIVMRFETIEELICFSVVCRLWNHFASTVKHHFNAKAMPWLLLVESTKNNPHCLGKVFNPINKKCYRLRLPETIGCRCWGTTYGWIVTFNYNLELHLINPLTKARISLPPISSLPLKWEFNVSSSTHDDSKYLIKDFFKKVFVLKVAQGDFFVFVTYHFESKRLAFARPGAQSWNAIDPPQHIQFESEVDFRCMRDNLSGCVVDVVCRGAHILILYEDASLGYLDVSDLNDPKVITVNDYTPTYLMMLGDRLGLTASQYIPAPPGILDGFEESMYGLYLVDSYGDLFMVLRDRYCLGEDDDGRDYEPFKFVVYHLDCEHKKWSRIHHLGDVALFLGNHSSMSVRANGAEHFKSNCIYYTDDEDDSWSEPITLGGKDMGVFNMENGEFEDIYDGCDKYSAVQTPLWFMPRV